MATRTDWAAKLKPAAEQQMPELRAMFTAPAPPGHMWVPFIGWDNLQFKQKQSDKVVHNAESKFFPVLTIMVYALAVL